MTLLTVVVSYNRLELLKRTVASYLATVTVPYRMVVVDNASGPDVRDWLEHGGVDHAVILRENRYPGAATNYGWSDLLYLNRRTGPWLYLHRSDNDVEYLPGWCDEVMERFEDPTLGQLGLRTLEEEGPHAAVGGNCIIRREVWDAGVRYNEAGWRVAPFEDGQMSWSVQQAGYRWARVERPCIIHTGIASSKDPYYQETFATRGITFADWGVA